MEKGKEERENVFFKKIVPEYAVSFCLLHLEFDKR